MDAVVWSALAVLAGGQIATLVYLGGRIDSVGTSMNALNARMDGLGESLNGRIDRVLDRRITRLER